MSHNTMDGHEGDTVTHPRIRIPTIGPAAPEEFARRYALFTEIDRIREQIGPIGMNAVDLIDADFYELDAETE